MSQNDHNSRDLCPLLIASGTATPPASFNELTDSELHHQLSRIADALEALARQNGQAMKPTYTVREAAHVLGKSEATIRRWIREGKLESAKSSESQQGQHMIPHHGIERYLQGS